MKYLPHHQQQRATSAGWGGSGVSCPMPICTVAATSMSSRQPWNSAPSTPSMELYHPSPRSAPSFGEGAFHNILSELVVLVLSGRIWHPEKCLSLSSAGAMRSPLSPVSPVTPSSSSHLSNALWDARDDHLGDPPLYSPASPYHP